jgi:hypothetical protein
VRREADGDSEGPKYGDFYGDAMRRIVGIAGIVTLIRIFSWLTPL